MQIKFLKFFQNFLTKFKKNINKIRREKEEVNKMQVIFNIFLIFTFVLINKGLVLAKVSGECSNCHTMHYSQNGTSNVTAWGSSGPYEWLTISDCVGCHSAGDSSTGIDPVTGAPIVYNKAEPSYGFYYAAGGKYEGLAGGNFYYVTKYDTHGHNIPGITNQDSTLSTAPGLNDNCEGCHGSSMSLGFGTKRKCPSGCTCCHDVGHHVDDSGPVVGNTTAWPAAYYRFLSVYYDDEPHPYTFIQPSTNFYGAEGIEDSDWEKTYDSTDHNEYAGGGNYIHSISLFCAVCHGDFYEYEKSGGGWYHHPTDYAIPNSGEYADAFGANGTGTGTWDPMVPVARPYSNLEGMTGPYQNVYIGTDMVQCLSCHRPHASPYADMLRWDYENKCTTNSTDDECGCIVCHTKKSKLNL